MTCKLSGESLAVAYNYKFLTLKTMQLYSAQASIQELATKFDARNFYASFLKKLA